MYYNTYTAALFTMLYSDILYSYFTFNTWGGASIKGQRYFVEIYLLRGVLVPINRENRGVTVTTKP